jgi:hypothetical protein
MHSTFRRAFLEKIGSLIKSVEALRSAEILTNTHSQLKMNTLHIQMAKHISNFMYYFYLLIVFFPFKLHVSRLENNPFSIISTNLGSIRWPISKIQLRSREMIIKG